MAAHLLATLAERGLNVTVDGDSLLVAPRERLDDELRSYIRQNKPVLLAEAKAWRDLETAITGCCQARGDTPENREALIADCWSEPADSWPIWCEYFLSEAARWTH